MTTYLLSPTLKRAIHDDVSIRFAGLEATGAFAGNVSESVVTFIDQVARVRNLARF
jgi:hypothetical protein